MFYCNPHASYKKTLSSQRRVSKILNIAQNFSGNILSFLHSLLLKKIELIFYIIKVLSKKLKIQKGL